MTMLLTSAAFSHGGTIPSRFTGDGDNFSPPLTWSGVPRGTRSFALICWDPDAPSGTWYHWAAFDIPITMTGLPERFQGADTVVRQGLNDFGTRAYGGPHPPRGHGPHHYHFTLYALDTDRLSLPAGAGCRDVERAARSVAITMAELIGIYAR